MMPASGVAALVQRHRKEGVYTLACGGEVTCDHPHMSKIGTSAVTDLSRDNIWYHACCLHKHKTIEKNILWLQHGAQITCTSC